MDMKYIIYDHLGIETPVLFPSFVDHCAMAPKNRDLLISAGKCSIDGTNTDVQVDSCIMKDVDVYCYDRSVTLNRESRNEIDAAIVKHMLMGGRVTAILRSSP